MFEPNIRMDGNITMLILNINFLIYLKSMTNIKYRRYITGKDLISTPVARKSEDKKDLLLL